MKERKSLITHIEENTTYQMGYYGRPNRKIHTKDFRGESGASRMFWKYRHSLSAVVLFGKIFGGFALILKTPRGLYGYSIMGWTGTLKFQYMEPQEVAKQIANITVIYKDPKLTKYLKDYIGTRGEPLFNIQVMRIDKELDRCGTDGGIINMLGKNIPVRCNEYERSREKDRALNIVKNKTIMRSKTGKLCLDAYSGSDWRPSGLFIDGEFLTTAHDLAGKSMLHAFPMNNTLVMREDEYLSKQLRESIDSNNFGRFNLVIYPNNEYSEEFRRVCGDAAAWFTFSRLKKGAA